VTLPADGDARFAFLEGRSQVAALMRGHDWSRSPLGPPEQWSQSLRSMVNLMLGSAFPMFVAWGPQLCQLYNDAYVDVMGSKHPSGLGRPLLENWAEIRDDVGPLAEQALRGDSRYVENMPLRMRRGRGEAEDTWFTFSYSPVQDDDGAIAGMFCACVETTQTVLAERELRTREEWLQSLFDQAPGFAAELRGPDHVFERANEGYRLMTGQRELIGLPVAQAMPEVVGQGFLELLDGVYVTGVPYVGRSVRVMLDRTPSQPPDEAFVDFMYQPLRDADGRITGIFVQGHEVTEQHRAREALRKADRQKDEFLATLAHELRNPLAPIRTASHLLASPLAAAPAKARATEIIARQVGQMSRLLDDLVDISRITQRRLQLQKSPVAVRALVDGAIETARPLADAKRHTIGIRIDDPGATLVADPVRLTQVLSNLLNNACKYTDPGGRIAIDARSEGDATVFTVADNGIGLQPRTIDNLFVMFAQEHSAIDRAEGGLGIGLALCKGLVELHGGTISAQSDGLGRGSRFEVRLPRDGSGAVAPAPAHGPRRRRRPRRCRSCWPTTTATRSTPWPTCCGSTATTSRWRTTACRRPNSRCACAPR
jgi:signal transduction histidine kinase